MKLVIAIVVMFAIVGVQSRPALAYLKFGVRAGGRDVTLKWADTPVRYFVNDRGVAGVTVADFQGAVGRGFSTWEAVATASIRYQFAGLTSALPGDDDSRSTLGFLEEPELDRVLASTSFLIDVSTGALLESDIFFNSSFSWSVAAAGERGRYDLESIALHEIGHLSGLGHSALGETELTSNGRRVLAAEAVMFPIAFPAGNIAGRALRADDIAGISDLYPDGGFAQDTGSISGRVRKSGAGVFGAHVVAFNAHTGTLVGGFSLNSEGQFSIAGLSPGPHVLRIEPLDDAAVESFFAPEAATDVDLRPKFYERLVVVPAGGDSGSIEVQVVRK